MFRRRTDYITMSQDEGRSSLVVSAQSGATRRNEASVVGEVSAPRRFRLGDWKEAAGGADPMDAGTYFGTAEGRVDLKEKPEGGRLRVGEHSLDAPGCRSQSLAERTLPRHTPMNTICFNCFLHIKVGK